MKQYHTFVKSNCTNDLDYVAKLLKNPQFIRENIK